MKRLCSFHRSGVSLAACLLASAFWAGCGEPAAQKDAAKHDPHANHSSGAPVAQKDAAKHDPHANHSHSTGTAAPEANPTPRIPAFFAYLEEAKPLPKVLDPKQFSTPVVARAYQYAAENPAVFAQQPCYCYCDAGYQHKSLLDCFATDHSAG